MSRTPRSRFLRYGAAVGGVLLAALVRRILGPVLGDHLPFFTFFIAVMLTAWYGRLGPSLVALLLGAAAGIAISGPAATDRQLAFPLAAYLVVGSGFAAFSEALQAARRRAEASEARFRTLTGRAPVGIFVTDAAGGCEFVNDRWCEMAGLTAVAARGPGWAAALHPDDRERVAAEWAAAARAGREFVGDYRFRTPAGVVTWVQGRAAPLRDAAGAVTGYVGTVTDTTEATEARTALEESGRRLRQLADSMPQVVYESRADGAIEYYNRRWYEYTGLAPDDADETNWRRHVHPDDLPGVAEKWAECRRTGTPLEAELRLLDRGGVYRWHLTRSVPVRDAAGRVVRWYGTSTDIDRQKQTEATLRQTKGLLDAVVENAPACVFAKDRQGRYLLANRALAGLVGRRVEDFAGRTDHDFFPPDVAAEFGRDDAAVITSGRSRTYEESFRVAGVTRTYLTVKFPLRDEAGVPYAACAVAADVTGLKRVEAELRATADRLNLALAAARLGDWSWDAATDLVTLSERAAEVFGVPPGSGMTWAALQQLLHPDDRDRARLRVEAAVAGHSQYETEYRVNRPDGAQVWVAALGRAHYAPDGEPRGMFGVVQDVTARKEAEAALGESEGRFRGLMEQAPFSVQLLAADGRTIRVNRAFEELWGLRAEQLADYVVLNDPQLETKGVLPFLRRAFAGEAVEIPAIEYDPNATIPDRTRHADPRRWVAAVAYPLKDEAGRVREVVLVHDDRTARIRAEDALREREERLRLALDAGRMGVWDWNVVTNEIRWSDNLEAVHGLAPGTFGGTFEAFQQIIHPDDRDAVGAAIARALAERGSYDVEFRNLWPDGSVHWMSGKGRVFAGDDGRPARMIGVGMDVTARKRAEQDARFLAAASAVLAGPVDGAGSLQTVADLAVPHFADWVAVDVPGEGDALRRVAVAHVDPSKVELAHELYRRFPPDPAAPQGVWTVLRTGESELVPEISDELLVASIKDPEALRVTRALGLRSYMGVPLRARGRVLGVVTFVSAESGRRYDAADLAVAEDLAHRAAVAVENARLYHEVREADRRKDEFLAVLGHELRNPLAPISNALQVLKRPGAGEQVAARAREMMERQVQHMVRLVDDLLDVSRIVRGKVELRREPVELAAVVARAVETTQPLVEAEGHRLSVALPPEPLWVSGDLVRLAQVVGNLLTNAARYTDRGGEIAVEAERIGDAAVLRVRDTGIGISAEALSRIWDMFVQADRRVKGSHGGMGVGLALVKGLVALHGGTVAARSDGPGKGSEFGVTLPLLPASAPEPRPAAAPGDVTRAAPRRVLVVDDNVDAAESLAILLRLGGHAARVAHDGPGALAAAEADPPEVAFLDIGMPGMDGYELARRFRAHPVLRQVRLIALTGWGQEDDRRRTREAGFDEHEVKPVSPEAVAGLLAEPDPKRDGP